MAYISPRLAWLGCDSPVDGMSFVHGGCSTEAEVISPSREFTLPRNKLLGNCYKCKRSPCIQGSPKMPRAWWARATKSYIVFLVPPLKVMNCTTIITTITNWVMSPPEVLQQFVPEPMNQHEASCREAMSYRYGPGESPPWGLHCVHRCRSLLQRNTGVAKKERARSLWEDVSLRRNIWCVPAEIMCDCCYYNRYC